MSVETANVPWIVHVHTDKYAGNFEREMTAYCTGQIGECGVGSEYTEDFEEDVPPDADGFRPFDDRMRQVADDNGCHRPCYMAQDENNEWHIVAMFFDDQPTEDDLRLIFNRAKDFGYRRPDQSYMLKYDPEACVKARTNVSKVTLIKNVVLRTQTVVTTITE